MRSVSPPGHCWMFVCSSFTLLQVTLTHTYNPLCCAPAHVWAARSKNSLSVTLLPEHLSVSESMKEHTHMQEDQRLHCWFLECNPGPHVALIGLRRLRVMWGRGREITAFIHNHSTQSQGEGFYTLRWLQWSLGAVRFQLQGSKMEMRSSIQISITEGSSEPLSKKPCCSRSQTDFWLMFVFWAEMRWWSRSIYVILYHGNTGCIINHIVTVTVI